MSINHIVRQGEHLSQIALNYGFRDYKIIWDHPDNAALKKLRKSPNVLMPGDTLRIRVTVLDAKRSRSKTDRGIVQSQIEVMNQRGEIVMSLKAINFLRTRSSV